MFRGSEIKTKLIPTWWQVMRMAAQTQTPEMPWPEACWRKEELKSWWSGPEQGFFWDQGSVEVEVTEVGVLFIMVDSMMLLF